MTIILMITRNEPSFSRSEGKHLNTAAMIQRVYWQPPCCRACSENRILLSVAESNGWAKSVINKNTMGSILFRHQISHIFIWEWNTCPFLNLSFSHEKKRKTPQHKNLLDEPWTLKITASFTPFPILWIGKVSLQMHTYMPNRLTIKRITIS